MRVKNTSIYMGQDEISLRHREEKAGQQKNRKSASAVSLNQQNDSILMKKQMAQKKAMKIVGDTFSAEHALDEEQNSRREKVDELRQQLTEIQGYITAQEELPEEEMTEEDRAAQKEALKEYQKQYDNIKNDIMSEIAAIRGTKLERLKSSPMIKAQKEAGEIMEAAGDEIIGMLMQEAKDHIDEEKEEREEKAEEIAEKREEEEERLDKSREKSEEAEAITEMIRKSASNDMKKEIEELLDKLKLIEEDIKGAAVDTQL